MTPEYAIAMENGIEAHDELWPLYCEHYAEMQSRLSADGVEIGPFNPRLKEYFEAMNAGYLLTFVVRLDRTVIGYSNVYVTNDMHNQDLIAQEDTIFITKAHRNGVGRKLVRFILDELKSRGVKRVDISARTDLRVAKIWERMGFKPTAQSMTYVF